jgi:hypothetical protein
MKNAVKKRPGSTRANSESRAESQPEPLTEEDKRDIRDGRRALAEAKREGVYPLSWLKKELEQ